MKTTHKTHRNTGTKWLKIWLITIALSSTTLCYSQEYKTNDTIKVDEVVVTGESISRFQAGVKIEKIDYQQLQLSLDGNLENLLLRHTPIAIKSQGTGLSTIRMRGTSPNHTSINFGGINLNSLTLGHSNMSNFPMFLFDEVGIQYGSSSAVNGSGNIGGAIHLGLKNHWVNGIKTEARIAHGSFGEQLYGTKVFLGNGKFESATRAYYHYKTNNFKFTNTEIRDVENDIYSTKDQQRRANIEDYGLIQELNFRISNYEIIKIMNWFQSSWRNTQPNMSSNLDTTAAAIPIKNKHARIWGEYNKKTKYFNYHFGVGYVYDYQNYNNQPNSIQTQRIIGQGHIEHKFIKNASYKVGIKTKRIYPLVGDYIQSLKYEDRADAYVSYRHLFFNRFNITVNLRKGHVSGYSTPITPSLGLSYLVFSNEFYSLKILSNIASSYRVGSFNDRYWNPGGNPDLKPESGINYELGFKWNYRKNESLTSVSINSFYLDIDNWIIWIPTGSIWEATSAERVISKGVELKIDTKYPISVFKINSGLNFSLNSNQRIRGTSTEALYRQIEYNPLLTGTLFSTISYKKTAFTIDGNYTHWQYTSKSPNNVLDEYILLNTSIIYNMDLNQKQKLAFIGSINNFTNKQYQSTLNYAMPGINYRITLKYNFN